MGHLVFMAPEPPSQHYHDYPNDIRKIYIRAHSIWECNCGKQFILKETKQDREGCVEKYWTPL